MRKLMLLLAAGSLWLFLAAIPVFADGGPHVTAANSGVSTLTADSCAGCHRAHTAQGEYLINQATEEDLCLGCHGAASTGATTDVMTGIQYAISGTGLRDSGTAIGALRAGGFDQARIGDVGRIDTGTNYKSKVVVGAAQNVTSSHIAMAANALTNPGVAWGSGENNSGVGATVSLSCASCHNPHGNGQYRILNPTPNAGSIAFKNYGIAKVDGPSDTVFTTESHEFSVGDVVKFTDVPSLAATSYIVVAVPNGVQLKLGTFAAAGAVVVTDLAAAGAAGSISRYQAVVTDAPLGTADANGAYPVRNYSVMQVKGTQGTDSGYLLYAADVLAARTAGSFNGTTGAFTATSGDYWHRQVPWNAASGSMDDAPNGQPATNPATAVGDVAFNVQITSWCTSCHTRYYANQNQNPTGNAPGTSAATSKTITTAAGGLLTTSASHSLQVDDVVTTVGLTGATGSFTVATVPSATTFTLAGATPTDGTGLTATVIRTSAPQSASSWWFPRTTAAGAVDPIYKFQHRTVPNRACTTCHVAHGSNRVMTGAFSSTFTTPAGTVDDSSRLLKVDNRGTCQACHDPTETWANANATGTYIGAAGGNVLP